MQSFLDILKTKKSLTRLEAKTACGLILSERAAPSLVASLLIALHDKKETDEEILGFLEAIRETSPPFPNENINLLDVCGTGGDGAQTFNVSTGVALILASLGVKVAKHGNRGVSSKSGSSDVLQSLKIKSDHTHDEVMTSLARHGLSFLFAPAFYPVLAKIAPIRKSLGRPTLFNALGPLLNPAPITHQLMGVYDESLLETSAKVLRARGVKRAFIVHGSDRLDELTLSGPSQVVALENGELRKFTLNPADFGLPLATADAVKGGGPEENAMILMQVFGGEQSAKRDLLVMNAAAGLVVAGLEQNFKDASLRVSHALESGRTRSLVESLRAR